MFVTKSFLIYTITDYNELMELFKEHQIELKDVKTVDYGVSRVYGCGEEHHIEFVKYLYTKYLERVLGMRNHLKRTTKDLEEEEGKEDVSEL